MIYVIQADDLFFIYLLKSIVELIKIIKFSSFLKAQKLLRVNQSLFCIQLISIKYETKK